MLVPVTVSVRSGNLSEALRSARAIGLREARALAALDVITGVIPKARLADLSRIGAVEAQDVKGLLGRDAVPTFTAPEDTLAREAPGLADIRATAFDLKGW